MEGAGEGTPVCVAFPHLLGILSKSKMPVDRRLNASLHCEPSCPRGPLHSHLGVSEVLSP